MQAKLQFDSRAARKARDRGMDLATGKRRALLAAVQSGLCSLAMKRESRICNADDGQRLLAERGFTSSDLGNAAGAMFPKSLWECVGWTKSERVIGHGNDIRKWRLK